MNHEKNNIARLVVWWQDPETGPLAPGTNRSPVLGVQVRSKNRTFLEVQNKVQSSSTWSHELVIFRDSAPSLWFREPILLLH